MLPFLGVAGHDLFSAAARAFSGLHCTLFAVFAGAAIRANLFVGAVFLTAGHVFALTASLFGCAAVFHLCAAVTGLAGVPLCGLRLGLRGGLGSSRLLRGSG